MSPQNSTHSQGSWPPVELGVSPPSSTHSQSSRRLEAARTASSSSAASEEEMSEEEISRAFSEACDLGFLTPAFAWPPAEAATATGAGAGSSPRHIAGFDQAGATTGAGGTGIHGWYRQYPSLPLVPPESGVRPGPEKYCKVCDKRFGGPVQYQDHKDGKKHKRNVLARKSAKGSESSQHLEADRTASTGASLPSGLPQEVPTRFQPQVPAMSRSCLWSTLGDSLHSGSSSLPSGSSPPSTRRIASRSQSSGEEVGMVGSIDRCGFEQYELPRLPRRCLTCGCALLRRGRGWCALCNAGLHEECLLACTYAAPCGHMFCPQHRHSHFGHAPILHGNDAVMTEERRGQPGQLHREGMSAPAGSSSLPLGSSPPSTRRIASRSQSSDSSPPAVIPLTDSESDHTASTGADGMVIWV